MSEISKYDYLKKYIKNDSSKEKLNNWFDNFDMSNIKEVEQSLGFEFPNQLKEFWQEIGYGFLRISNTGEDSHLDNRILAHDEIADILLLKEDSHYILSDVAEELEPGDMPFFHFGDSSSFLIMRPTLENPNAVYSWAGRKIEDNFETFIYRLYHESPKYYLYVNNKK